MFLPSFQDRNAADPGIVMTSTSFRIWLLSALAILAVAGVVGIGVEPALADAAPSLEAGSRREEVHSSVVSSSSTGVLEGNRVVRALRGFPVGTELQEFNVEEGRLERASPRLSPPASNGRPPASREEPGGGRSRCREVERLEARFLSSQNGHGSEEPGFRRTSTPSRHDPPPSRGAESLRASSSGWRLSRTT